MSSLPRPRIVSIANIRAEAQSVVDWFQYRLDHGDILLDAWMEPSFDAAKEIIKQVDELQRLGWNTMGTPPAKKSFLAKLLPFTITRK